PYVHFSSHFQLCSITVAKLIMHLPIRNNSALATYRPCHFNPVYGKDSKWRKNIPIEDSVILQRHWNYQ
ncbi:MAG TPA: hypothetical protein VEY51_05075, partial [Chondromyces sp.]|nr:hypothetical protein [Chondromyces sp.]